VTDFGLAKLQEGGLETRTGNVMGTFGYKGFWTMARKYWKTGFEEVYRSLSKGQFTKALQRLVPEIRAEDLEGRGSGVRAQAVESTRIDALRGISGARGELALERELELGRTLELTQAAPVLGHRWHPQQSVGGLMFRSEISVAASSACPAEGAQRMFVT
jgi:L-2-hydroxyglutarate oxidase LhgO